MKTYRLTIQDTWNDEIATQTSYGETKEQAIGRVGIDGIDWKLISCEELAPKEHTMNEKIWWVVEYMDGGIKQILILAYTAKEAKEGFSQVLRVVAYK